MVRIIELMEDELALPKSLNPGTAAKINGDANIDKDSTLNLKTIRSNQKLIRSMGIKNKWGGSQKTPEELKSEMELVGATMGDIQNKSNIYANEVKDAIPFIEKNCSKYLPFFRKSGFLYRGFHDNDLAHGVFYGYPRADRIPSDSSGEFQQLFDKVLTKLGVSALRSNSLFCTREEEKATDYGLPFIIIPCNDATYTWSHTYDDIVLDRFEAPQFGQLQRQLARGLITFDQFVEKVQAIYQIDNTNLDLAMKKKHEVWIHGHYVAVLGTLESQLHQLLFK